MVVDADRNAGTHAATRDAEHERGRAVEREGAAAGGPVPGTRRQLMRGLLAPALAVGLAPLVAASGPTRAAEVAAGRPGRGAHTPDRTPPNPSNPAIPPQPSILLVPPGAPPALARAPPSTRPTAAGASAASVPPRDGPSAPVPGTSPWTADRCT